MEHNTRLKVLFAVLTSILVLPFVILAWYSNPSADDYIFAYRVVEMGFMESQVFFYNTWTGRYVSTFLISVHPLIVNSLVLYKLVSFLFVLFTIHASYYFISTFFVSQRHHIRFWVGLIITYVCLNGFPSLIQGVYWMPGSITYHLGNILAIYFVGFALRAITGIRKPAVANHVLFFFLVMAVCGLSETGMILMLILSFSAFLFNSWVKRRFSLSFLVYVLGAVVSSLIIVLAPGNDGRGNLSAEADKMSRIFRAFELSFSGTLDMIYGWLFTPEILVISVVGFISVLTFKIRKNIRVKSSWTLLVYLIWALCLLWATLLPAYYVMSGYPPGRAMNVSYWTFIFLWVGLVFLATSRFQEAKPEFSLKKPFLLLTMSILAFFLALEKSDNFFIASGDILSGRAHRFNEQYINRDNLMRSCDSDICTVPTFTSHPRSVFNEDLMPGATEGFNGHYAYLFGKNGVIVTPEEPERYFNFLMDMEGDNPLQLENWHTITEKEARSGVASSKIDKDNPHGVLFRKRFNALGLENIFTISHSDISVYCKCAESSASAQMIFAITNPGQTITHLWQAYPINCNSAQVGEWFETRLRIPIDKRLIGRRNMIIVYVGYSSSHEILVDDLQMTLY